MKTTTQLLSMRDLQFAVLKESTHRIMSIEIYHVNPENGLLKRGGLQMSSGSGFTCCAPTSCWCLSCRPWLQMVQGYTSRRVGIVRQESEDAWVPCLLRETVGLFGQCLKLGRARIPRSHTKGLLEQMHADP